MQTFSETENINSLSLSFWWFLHEFHKCILLIPQIVQLTASGLSDFALYHGFLFLRFIGFLDRFV